MQEQPRFRPRAAMPTWTRSRAAAQARGRRTRGGFLLESVVARLCHVKHLFVFRKPPRTRAARFRAQNAQAQKQRKREPARIAARARRKQARGRRERARGGRERAQARRARGGFLLESGVARLFHVKHLFVFQKPTRAQTREHAARGRPGECLRTCGCGRAPSPPASLHGRLSWPRPSLPAHGPWRRARRPGPGP